MSYCFNNVFHTSTAHPLDHSLSLKFECKTDIELIKENPVIELGGIMVVKTSDGSVFGYKLGDGKTPYNSLPYIENNFSDHSPFKIELDKEKSTQIIDGGTSHV